jgi:hypothetical protein
VKADLVQDPVDESPRFLTAVLFRQFYGLVDGDTLGDIVPEEEFVRRQAQDVAFHRGDARQAPVGGVGLDRPVQLGKLLRRASHQGVRKCAHLGRHYAIAPELLQHGREVGRSIIQLVQQHQRELTRLASFAHDRACVRS